MSRRRYSGEAWARLTELEDRQAEQQFTENYNLPKDVMRNQLSIDDDPETFYYNPDVVDW